MKKISELIAEDLKKIMVSKNISDYYIYKKLKLCSEGTFKKIIKGKGCNSIPLAVVLKIYKAIGENEINIQTDNFKLYVKLNIIMDIFNLNLPPEDSENDKFPKLDSWFDFMNNQFKKIEENQEKTKELDDIGIAIENFMAEMLEEYGYEKSAIMVSTSFALALAIEWKNRFPCEHPYHAIIGEEHGNSKCLKCGECLY